MLRLIELKPIELYNTFRTPTMARECKSFWSSVVPDMEKEVARQSRILLIRSLYETVARCHSLRISSKSVPISEVLSNKRTKVYHRTIQ